MHGVINLWNNLSVNRVNGFRSFSTIYKTLPSLVHCLGLISSYYSCSLFLYFIVCFFTVLCLILVRYCRAGIRVRKCGFLPGCP